jgi:hypothetical protein
MDRQDSGQTPIHTVCTTACFRMLLNCKQYSCLSLCAHSFLVAQHVGKLVHAMDVLNTLAKPTISLSHGESLRSIRSCVHLHCFHTFKGNSWFDKGGLA